MRHEQEARGASGEQRNLGLFSVRLLRMAAAGGDTIG